METCMFPLIDNQNNIIYYTISETGQRYYYFYSNKTGRINKIDVKVKGCETFTSTKDVSLVDGTLVYTGKDNNIYSYIDEKLEKITTKNVNYNPVIKKEWLAWIFRDIGNNENNSGKILIRGTGKEIILDSVFCYLGLDLSSNWQFLFTRVNPQEISPVDLYYGIVKFESEVDTLRDNIINVFPNQAKDLMTITINALGNLNNTDIIIRDLGVD